MATASSNSNTATLTDTGVHIRLAASHEQFLTLAGLDYLWINGYADVPFDQISDVLDILDEGLSTTGRNLDGFQTFKNMRKRFRNAADLARDAGQLNIADATPKA